MDRIIRKEVENEIRANTKKKIVEYPFNIRPLGFASLDTLFRNCTYEEAAEKLKRAFDEAAEQYDVAINKLVIAKASGQGSVIKSFRLETDEELELRIQRETNKKVEKLRCENQQKRNTEYQKKKKIEQLQKELSELIK